MNEFQWPRLDKTKFSVVSLYDREDDLQYWKNATPEERLEAMELMRRLVYGNYAATSRLQRVLEIPSRTHS